MTTNRTVTQTQEEKDFPLATTYGSTEYIDQEEVLQKFDSSIKYIVDALLALKNLFDGKKPTFSLPLNGESIKTLGRSYIDVADDIIKKLNKYHDELQHTLYQYRIIKRTIDKALSGEIETRLSQLHEEAHSLSQGCRLNPKINAGLQNSVDKIASVIKQDCRSIVNGLKDIVVQESKPVEPSVTPSLTPSGPYY